MTTPESTSTRVRSWPRSARRDEIDERTVARPPAKASASMPSTGSDSRMPSTAPSPAPVDDAEDVRRHQRIAEQRLVGRAGARQRRADQDRGRDPRQPHPDEHDLARRHRASSAGRAAASPGVRRRGQRERAIGERHQDARRPARQSAPGTPGRACASAAASARLRSGQDAVECGVVGLGLIEQLEELARRDADVFGKSVRIEQPRDPPQPDGAVDRGRRVDPAERQPRREVDALGRDRRDRRPQRVVRSRRRSRRPR